MFSGKIKIVGFLWLFVFAIFMPADAKNPEAVDSSSLTQKVENLIKRYEKLLATKQELENSLGEANKNTEVYKNEVSTLKEQMLNLERKLNSERQGTEGTTSLLQQKEQAIKNLNDERDKWNAKYENLLKRRKK